MLSNRLLQRKTYEELMQEARMQIPLYTREWTNLNPSDPAITVLETLSAFTMIQQDSIYQMPEIVQRKLFSLAGFEGKRGKGARVLLSASNVSRGVRIPSGQKFTVGGMSFETNRQRKVYGHSLLGIYGKNEDEIKDFSYVLDPDVPMKVAVFTEKPKAGMELYIVSDGLGDPGDELIFYVEMEESFHRNKLEEGQAFSRIQWEYYTKNGFIPLKQKDTTEGLLQSGELRFRLSKEEPEVYTGLPMEGYVIRGVLQMAEYDIPPKLFGVHGFLFEVWQKDTEALCYTFPRKQQIEVYSDILEEKYWQIFCKEQGEESYRLYTDAAFEEENIKGRYYETERLGFGRYTFSFDRDRFGYGPGDYINAIKLVAYTEDMMNRFYLGQIYGYDNQEIELPRKNIMREGFSVLARRETEDGEFLYDFVKPDSSKEFTYELFENDGKLVIREAGDFIGARLYLCACASTKGEEGNLRPNSIFQPVGYETEIVFSNPAPGKGGQTAESMDDVKNRFIQSMNCHYTAVKASDYENIVKTTPGLCIHKVKAVMNKEKNQVQVVVKPYGAELYPKLSKTYEEVIRRRLEERRLLTTNVTLVQPVYAEVSVQGTVYVKPHYRNCLEKIKEVIRKELDYVGSEKNFGERLHFDLLFHRIEALDFVEFVFELSATSQNLLYAVKQGMDIQPMDCCLLIPGNIQIELNTME